MASAMGVALSPTHGSWRPSTRTVVFSLPAEMTLGEFALRGDSERFSRIPVYRDEPEQITGFVLRSRT